MSVNEGIRKSGIGVGCFSSREKLIGICKSTLDDKGQPMYEGFTISPTLIAQLLGYLAQSEITSEHLNVFKSFVNEFPSLSWKDVIASLDYSDYNCPSVDSVRNIGLIFAACTTEPFPYQSLFLPWKNSAGQLSLLKAAINSSSDKTKGIVPFLTMAPRGTIFRGLTAPLSNVQEPWTRVAFVECLCRLAEAYDYSAVRKIFEIPIVECPDVLVLSLAEAKGEYVKLRDEFLSILVPYYMTPVSCNYPILHRIWSLNKELLLATAVSMYTADNNFLNYIHKMGDESVFLPNWIAELLGLKSFFFVIDLAVLQCVKINEQHRLEEWLQSMLLKYSSDFGLCFLQFIKTKLVQVTPLKEGEEGKYPAGVISIFYKCLESIFSNPNLKVIERDARELKDFIIKTKSDKITPEEIKTIEKECGLYFQKLYKGELPVSTFVDLLLIKKESLEIKDRKLYDKVMNSLFDEFKFYANYPDRELGFSGLLLGEIVLKSRGEGGVSLKLLTFIYESLKMKPTAPSLAKQPTNTPGRLYFLATIALEVYIPILIELPSLCTKYLAVPHFSALNPELAKLVQEALTKGNEIAAKAAEAKKIKEEEEIIKLSEEKKKVEEKAALEKETIQKMASDKVVVKKEDFKEEVFMSTFPLDADATFLPLEGELEGEPLEIEKDIETFFSDSLNIGGELGGGLEELASKEEVYLANKNSVEGPEEVTPPINIQEAVFVKLNNITEKTVIAFSASLSKILIEIYYPWMSNYLVDNRLCTQPNYHDVYLSMLECMNNKELDKQVMISSVNIATKMLRDKVSIVVNSSKRNSIKNLGLWIGKFCIARSKPLLQKYLDMKELLLEAYENGTMIAVVPFVSNIMKSCKDGVFAPPNPWTMGVLNVFCELYQVHVDGYGVKINLLFEIEILFNHLSLKITEVKASDFIKDRKKPSLIENPDFASTLKEPKGGDKKEIKRAVASSPPSTKRTNNGSVEVVVPTSEKTTATTSKTTNSTSTPVLSTAPINSAATSPPPSSTTTSTNSSSAPTSSLPKTTSEAISTDSNIVTGSKTVTVIPNLAKYIRINSSSALYQKKPALMIESVTLAVDIAIREVIQPVVLSSVAVALCTAKEVILNDFAFESDEVKMRHAAHLMVSNLAGNLASVTCKEPLMLAISSNIVKYLEKEFGVNNPDVLEAAEVNANENIILGVLLIEKATCEKAVRDMDTEFNYQYDLRSSYRVQGKRYYDEAAFKSGKFHKLPEYLRPQSDNYKREQERLYEGFIRTKTAMLLDGKSSSSEAPFDLGSCLDKINALLTKITNTVTVLSSRMDINQDAFSFQTSIPDDHDLKVMVSDIRVLSKSLSVNREDLSLKYANKIFKILFENSAMNIKLQVFLNILVGFKDGFPKLPMHLTNWLVIEPDKRKLNIPVIVGMVRYKLLLLPEFDLHLSKLMAGGYDEQIFEFALQLIQHVLVIEQLEEISVFFETITMLKTSPQGTPHHKAFQYLLQILANKQRASSLYASPPRIISSPPKKLSSSPSSDIGSKSSDPSLHTFVIAVRVKSDVIFVDRIVYLMDTWMGVLKDVEVNGMAGEKGYGAYLGLLQQQGVLKGDENIDQFFKVMTEISIQKTLSKGTKNAEGVIVFDYTPIEAYTSLIILLMKYADTVNANARVNLFNKVLSVFSKILVDDHDIKAQGNVVWDQRPYCRFFHSLMNSLINPDNSDPMNPLMISNFAQCFLSINPSRVPGFIFSWTELICDRVFFPKLLSLNIENGHAIAHKMLVTMLTFLDPHFKQVNFSPTLKILYEGVLRIFLVLLNDFPEFLSEFCFSLTNAIPHGCVQLRNIVLSAYPSAMKLPDPFDPDLRVELIPEISIPPKTSNNISLPLMSKNNNGITSNVFKTDLDSFLYSRKPATFLKDIINFVKIKDINEISTAGSVYDVSVINSLVLYIGHQATSGVSVLEDAPWDIFQTMLLDFTTEGRYHVLNAIANQLRYPNAHTLYFSRLLLFLFSETTDTSLQEQITRVLLERLIAQRPHPWGLLISFLDLRRNPKYKLWSIKFANYSNELEKVFEQVSNNLSSNIKKT